MAQEEMRRGKFEDAKLICLDAVRTFELQGTHQQTSIAYHLLGEIAYRQEDLENAESWFRRAIAIDELHGNKQLGYARTCNNLGAVANAAGKYDEAEDWLQKSIYIKELNGDERGIAASYHQMGIVAETRLDFETAEKWYLKSLAIEQKLDNTIGMIQTILNLSNVAEIKADKSGRNEWHQKALRILEEKGESSIAISLGQDAQLAGFFDAAEIMYQKALDLASKAGDDERRSLSFLGLGHVACGKGDRVTAVYNYSSSLKIDEQLQASERAGETCLRLSELFLVGVDDCEPDFRSAKKWYQKALTFKREVSWTNLLRVHAYFGILKLVRYFRGIGSKVGVSHGPG
jgi:tetratricopeptide (TPR) repeat protein